MALEIDGAGRLHGAEGGDGQVGRAAGGFQQPGAEAGDARRFFQRREAGGDHVSRAEVQQPAGAAAAGLRHVRHDERLNQEAERVVQRMRQIDADAEAKLALPLAAGDEQRVEHPLFLPAMERQAAGENASCCPCSPTIST